MEVMTDHQILAFGADLMHLLDRSTGNTLVTATRDPGGLWTIHADGTDDVTAVNRGEAITDLTEQARKILPGYPSNGFSTLVPHGLTELP